MRMTRFRWPLTSASSPIVRGIPSAALKRTPRPGFEDGAGCDGLRGHVAAERGSRSGGSAPTSSPRRGVDGGGSRPSSALDPTSFTRDRIECIVVGGDRDPTARARVRSARGDRRRRWASGAASARESRAPRRPPACVLEAALERGERRSVHLRRRAGELPARSSTGRAGATRRTPEPGDSRWRRRG
jgi:hypothetical protein